MEYIGITFGIFGFIFGLSAYARVDKLEKRLKELEVLPEQFSSEE